MLHQSRSWLLLRHCANCNFEQQAAVLIQMDEDEECRVVQCFQELLQHRDFWCSLPAVIRCHDDECNADFALLSGWACHLADLCPSTFAAPSHHMALVFGLEMLVVSFMGKVLGSKKGHCLQKCTPAAGHAGQWSSDPVAVAGLYQGASAWCCLTIILLYIVICP